MSARRRSLLASGAVALLGAALIFGGSAMSASAAVGDDGTPPTRTLDVAASGIIRLQAIAISPSGRLYTDIDGSDGILIFAAGASGTDAPIGSIEGPATQLTNNEYALAFDPAGNLWVADQTQVLEFAAGTNGNVAPIQVLTGGSAGFSGVEGIAIGRDGQIYTADLGSATVDVFAPTASGADEPIRRISGSNTTFSLPDGITVDADGTIYVGDFGTDSIDVFASNADGNVAPTRSITGASTGLNDPYYLALDAGNVYAANFGASTVTAYPSGADGDVAPIRTITGASTQTSGPFPITISGGEIYVGNWLSTVIAVFNTVTPVSAISPSSGPTAGGGTVTVTGSGFSVSAPAVTIGGHAATNVVVLNDTTLTADVPAGTAGVADVTVTIPGYEPGTLAGAFRYVAPELAATGIEAGPAGLVGTGLLLVGAAMLLVRRRALLTSA